MAEISETMRQNKPFPLQSNFNILVRDISLTTEKKQAIFYTRK